MSATKGFAPPENVKQLFSEKLESSGLNDKDAKQLGITYHTGAETKAMGHWTHLSLPGMRLPYFDPRDGKPLSAAPRWPQFYRMRALRIPVPTPDNFAKYLQPPQTGACAYFPHISNIDWPEIIKDTRRSIIITEGELKASKSCKEGNPTIGLGGVNSYSSGQFDISFLPELECVSWVRRVVYIVYDSDLRSNPHVCRAAWGLTQELVARGAQPHIVILPTEGSSKVGLDDYLVAHGVESFDELVTTTARTLGAAKTLWAFNEQYAALMVGDREIVDLETGQKIKATQLSHRVTRTFSERRLTADGTIVTDTITAASAWLNWPLRQNARQLVFDPRREPMSLVPTEKPDTYDFNTWPGLAVEPQKGDVSPFLKLIDHLFVGSDQKVKDWFLNWLAYPLQHLGTKMFSAVVIHGLVQGSGKTMVAETMRRIYGSAYTMIGQAQLIAPFNPWAASRAFILGDDITGLDKMELHDKLKVMISQTRVWINSKNVSEYELDDYTNWFFTSNRPNAFYLDRGDRRFFVHEVPESVGKLPQSFYSSYVDWLDNGGSSALLHYFQSRDTGDFDPSAPAIDTASKNKMREESQSELAVWVHGLHTDSESLLVNGKVPMDGDLFSAKQLRMAYARQTGVNAEDPRLVARMSGALTAAGFNQVHGRKWITGHDIDPDRYYAIRNAEQWLKASLAEIQAHLRGEAQAERVRKTTPRKRKY